MWVADKNKQRISQQLMLDFLNKEIEEVTKEDVLIFTSSVLGSTQGIYWLELLLVSINNRLEAQEILNNIKYLGYHTLPSVVKLQSLVAERAATRYTKYAG
jgi:hypothetical protein